MNYQIIKISEQPNWILKAALWFSKPGGGPGFPVRRGGAPP